MATVGKIGRFTSIEHGLEFCGKSFHWQNHEHHHWGLGLLAPATVHFGQADTIPTARRAMLTSARRPETQAGVQAARAGR